jgi:hypothetical protein
MRPAKLDRSGTWSILWLPALLAMLASLHWVFVIHKYRNYGLNIRDEAFYIVTAKYAQATTVLSTDFGFYLRPLIVLGGETIGGFRLVGIALFAISSLCATSALGSLFSLVNQKNPPWSFSVVSFFCLLASSFTYYSIWLLSPSYNLLSLVLTIASVSGLLKIVSIGRTTTPGSPLRWRDYRLSWMLAWPCSAMAFIKPPAGIAVGFLAVSILITHFGVKGTLRYFPGFVFGGVTAGVIHVILIGGKVFDDFERLSRGRQAIKLSESYGSAESLFNLEFLEKVFSRILLFASIQVLFWLIVRNSESQVLKRVASTLILSATALLALRLLPVGGNESGYNGPLSEFTGWSWSSGSGIWWIIYSATCMLWMSVSIQKFSNIHRLGPMILVLGVISTVGSNNGIITMSSSVGVLFVFALLVHAVSVFPSSSKVELAPKMGLVFGVSIVSLCSLLMPMRTIRSPFGNEGPLSNRTELVAFKGLGSIRTTKSLALYIGGVRSLVNGLPAADTRCVVNLASTPITSLALDRGPTGSAWLTGGTKGWERSAAYTLSFSSCKSRRFLIIEAPTSALNVSRSVLGSIRFVREVGRIRFDDSEMHVFSLVE